MLPRGSTILRRQHHHAHRRWLRALSSSASDGIPEAADIVVVGGGIIGNSVAYHLAKLGGGKRDVLLLERDQITSGTTWHAAGLMVTFGSLSETSTEMRKYTKELYSTVLEEETGQSTGFKPCGFIELATNADRLEEYRRVSDFNRHVGVDVHEISAAEVEGMFPLCRTDDVLAGFYVEDDGRVNPVDATVAFNKAARKYGAKVCEGAAVARLLTEPTPRAGGRRACGVELEDGRVVKANTVVNCAGMWARQLSETAGVVCPNQAAEHYYLVTDAMDDVDPNWPVIEDPSSYTYIRPEGAGLMVGLFETDAAAWNVGRVPGDFSFGEIPPDWERMAPFLDKAMNRVPRSLEVGAKNFFCGPESFTPDLNPILGPAPEVDNLFIAAGMNSIGILTGGGAGRLVAQWILDGHSEYDVTGVSPDRFHSYQQTPRYRRDRVEESLGKVYKCHYPNDAVQSCRGARHSPLQHRLRAKGAFFRDVSGFESADWYTADGSLAPPNAEANPPTWGRPAWFSNWAAEHEACRTGVVLMDMSFMSKFAVSGAGAGALLNRLATADVDPPLPGDGAGCGGILGGAGGGAGPGSGVGRITYTQFLNTQGTVEADLTVTKLGEDNFMVVAGDTAHRHVESWIHRHAAETAPDVAISDATGALAQINIQGPRSRALLQAVVGTGDEDDDADAGADAFSDDAFAFRDAQHVNIGFAKALCVRITYLGELGYELYVPVEQAEHVYDEICAVGETPAFGLRHAGLKALASLRLEKGYRDYGHDVDNTDMLLETGLGFTADLEKPGGFVGSEATRAHKMALTGGKGKGPMRLRKRLVNVKCAASASSSAAEGPLLHHGEVLFRDGKSVGYVRAASYGHTLGAAVGIAQIDESEDVVNKAFLTSGDWTVLVAGKHHAVDLSLAPFYDPKNARIKGGLEVEKGGGEQQQQAGEEVVVVEQRAAGK